MAASPASTRRRRAPTAEAPVDRRTAIVSAATAVLGREGFGNTSIKDIAAEAGVAPGLVHYYFSSKEELLLAVVDRLSTEASEQWHGAIRGLTDPFETINAALDASAEYVRTHPHFFRIVFELNAVGFSNPAVARGLEELWRRQIADMELEIVAVHASLGIEPPLPSGVLAQLVSAAVDGVALKALSYSVDIDELHRGLKLMLGSMLATSALAAGVELPIERLRRLVDAGRLPV